MDFAVHAEAALASTNFAPDSFQHDEEKGDSDLDIKFPAMFEGKDEAFYTAPIVPKGNTIQRPRPAHVSQGSPYKVSYNVPF
ncbi:hypothetical protein H0H87_012947 [Tephrocybe sp. NHM501043]|nr:hypothetical protein H0H87_012947 [Tephrocybe sp. NHM501043]